MLAIKGLKKLRSSITGKDLPAYFIPNMYIKLFILLLPNFRERMYQLERKEMELEIEERKMMEEKKNIINEAARKADEPVDDSKLVEAMFDFLPDSSSEAPTPGR